ncbi:uncharacterized protein LOC111129871 isoform X3 [Crassostrea virginica]
MLSERREDPCSLIFDAIFYGNKNEVQQLISGGVDKNVVTHRHVRWDGASALGAAAYEGHMDIVRYLIDIGTSVNFCDPCQRRTPLHWACLGNQYQAAAYLIKHGADVNHRDLEQTTPILRAALGRNIDLVKCLIENGADVRHIDILGCSVLHYACVHGDKKLINTVIRAGCISNNVAVIGKATPLQTLSKQNDRENVSQLLAAGYNLENDQNWVDSLSPPITCSNPTLEYEVRFAKARPLSLKGLCRKTIRNEMRGVKVEQRLNNIPCPALIRQYLILDHL